MGWFDALNLFGLDLSVSRGDFSNQDVPDTNALMIIAGPCGLGKPTLLRAVYKEKLLLFGSELAQYFSNSCRDRSYGEHDDYKVAWCKKSFFRPVMSSCLLERFHCLSLCCCMWISARCCAESTPPIGPILFGNVSCGMRVGTRRVMASTVQKQSSQSVTLSVCSCPLKMIR